MAQANTGRYYVGISPKPQERVGKHNAGIGAKLAKDQGPFKLVYTSTPFPSKSDARKREIQLKGWTRQKKQKIISGEWK